MVKNSVRVLTVLSLIGIVFLNVGCVKSSMAQFQKEMGNDHAAVGTHVMTPYGSGDGWRVNPNTNQDVKITRPDGTVIEIKSH